MKKLIGVNKRVENNGKRVIWQATIKKMINGKSIKFKKDAPYTEEGLYKCGLFYNIISSIINGKFARQNDIPQQYLNLFTEEEKKQIETKVLNKLKQIL